MKYRITLVLLNLAYSTNTTACFIQQDDLVQQHESAFFSMLSVSAILFCMALLARYFSDKKRLWKPIVVSIIAGIIPLGMHILFIKGIAGPGGGCGKPELLEIGQVLTASFALILIYEVFILWKTKRLTS